MNTGNMVPVEEFTLPDGAVIEGYYISGGDGLRYPYGRSTSGFWAADEFGWASWNTLAERDGAIVRRNTEQQEH